VQQLTTPELKDYDSVFPGENWFFYWKTSPSLWESKLQNYNDLSPIFIPVYWGLHSENPDQFDFGTNRPEADLKRLFNLANQYGKDVILVLPLSPCPFLTNGGIPSYLSRSLMMNKDGMIATVVDSEKRLNKLFSFYDPRVFQSFRKFTWALGQFLTQNGFNKEVFGADFGYLSNNRYQSYFDDYSTTFMKGYHRYLAQLEQTDPEKVERLIADKAYDEELKKDYANIVKNLYLDSAVETIPANWSGILKFSCLGGSPEDLFSRSFERWETEGQFIKPLLNILVNDLIPSSVLLSKSNKSSILKKALKDTVSQSLLKSHLNNELYEEDLHTGYHPQVFFKVYCKDNQDLLDKTTLKYFFDRDYQWMYRIFHRSFIYTQEYEDVEKIHFFFGKGLNVSEFNQILKLFLNGSKIFIDSDMMHADLTKKLNIFLTENSIETERINFLTPLLKASLGDGLIIVYDSEKLGAQPLMKRINFWETMVKFLKLKTCKLEIDDGLLYVWKNRGSNTYELSYEEIRRLSFYNPTSYKRRATIQSSSNYAFLKTLDETNVEIKSNPIGIDIDLMPGGSVSIDCGYFE
jgi:hypothetical protein